MYKAEHGLNVTTGSSIPGILDILKPDIMDFNLKEIGEIKPLSLWGVATGPVQLIGYLKAANKFGVPGAPASPNKPWTPST
jgi:hypothetical protein